MDQVSLVRSRCFRLTPPSHFVPVYVRPLVDKSSPSHETYADKDDPLVGHELRLVQEDGNLRKPHSPCCHLRLYCLF